MPYRVTYAIDSLDPNPSIAEFDSEWEAIEFLSEEIERRVDWIIQHSPYALDGCEIDAIRETESSLARIDTI